MIRPANALIAAAAAAITAEVNRRPRPAGDSPAAVLELVTEALVAAQNVTLTDAELEENLRVDGILDGLQERNWTRGELDGHAVIARLLADGGK
jgi:hypothetical protein